MTKKDLVKIIREVVKQEVKKEVSKILISEQRTSAVSSKKSKPIVRKKPVKKEVQYTSNTALNDILNETVGGIEGNGTSEFDEYPTMGGGTFDSTRAAELLGYGDTMGAGNDKELQRQVGAVQTMKDAGVTTDQVPENVINALTKDYSAVMKAIDQKKGKNGESFRP
tara:strand:+ start:1504 stop:2004 length:501 start_codon:yes stop_codon:yes gene_type:complete